MTEELFWTVVAVSASVVGGAAVVIAWSIRQLAADGRRAAQDGDQLLSVLREELPTTLEALEAAAHSLERLAAESHARIELADRLADEGEATMNAVRELAGSINEIMRGPADTVTGVRRSARMVGQGIAHGAGRIRKVIVRDEADDIDDAG